MTDDSLRIQVEPRSPVRRKPSRRPWLTWGGLVVALVALGAFALLRPRGFEAPPAAPQVVAQSAVVAPPAAVEPALREQVVDDDGRLLWASPTAGPPIALGYVPAGTQVLVHLRPAALAAHPEGAKALAALGPWGDNAKGEAERLLGLPLADVEELMLSVTTATDDSLLFSLRARLVAGAPRPAQSESVGRSVRFVATSRSGDADAIAATVLVVCSQQLAAELREASTAPPLAADLERLVAASDADRLATVIFAPRFLQASGGKLVTGAVEPLRAALRWLTEDRAAAVALSMHWDDDFFTELRTAPVRSAPAQPTSVRLKSQILAAPAAVEEFVAAAPWHSHGRRVLMRLPAMLRAASRFARNGVEQNQAVVRCYLPAPAGHNLLLAAELALTLPRNEGARAATSEAPLDSRPETIDGKLRQTVTLSFPKDTLSQAIELLAAEIETPIEILGSDLFLEGITKNQSFAIDQRNRPAGDVLVEILRLANPDRTATGPADPRQKLVYVILSAADGRAGRIVITTRAAAAKRGEALPPVFRDE